MNRSLLLKFVGATAATVVTWSLLAWVVSLADPPPRAMASRNAVGQIAAGIATPAASAVGATPAGDSLPD